MSDELVDFLRDNKDRLKFSAIDSEIGAVQGTTARVVRGVDFRHFTEEQRTAINKYLKKQYTRFKNYLKE